MNELLMDASRIGVRVEERRLPSGLCGIYYEPALLIILDESLPDFQRRCTLCHELVHARYTASAAAPHTGPRPNAGRDARPRSGSSIPWSTRAPKPSARVTRIGSRVSWM